MMRGEKYSEEKKNRQFDAFSVISQGMVKVTQLHECVRVVESGSLVFVDDDVVAAAGSNQVSSEVHWSLSTFAAKGRLMAACSAKGYVGLQINPTSSYFRRKIGHY